ncbi:MAG: hypothetical protein RLZZ74_1401, partial [Cyanobacteriota bacterium]
FSSECLLNVANFIAADIFGHFIERSWGLGGHPQRAKHRHSLCEWERVARCGVLLAFDWGVGWSRDMGRVGWHQAADGWDEGGMAKMRESAGKD